MTQPYNPNQPTFGTGQGGTDINRMHDQDDRDIGILSHHHTLGIFPGQASPGDHIHDGKQSKRVPYTSVSGTPFTPVAASTSPIDETVYGVFRQLGGSLTYARGDHSHGSPVAPVVAKDAPSTATVNLNSAINVFQDITGCTTTITTTKASAQMHVNFAVDLNYVTGQGFNSFQIVINGVAQAGNIVISSPNTMRLTMANAWVFTVGITTGVIVKVQGNRSIAGAGNSNTNNPHTRMTVLVFDI